MSAKYLLVANWKMNLGREASEDLARKVRRAAKSLSGAEVWIAPSFTNIPAISKVLEGGKVRWGSQNVSGFEQGPFTGEVSVPMLRDWGATFAIVGHSDRRALGESDGLVAERAVGALKQGFRVVYCFGERAAERSSGQTMKVVRRQLMPLVEAIPGRVLGNLVLAYEPVWAIGTGTVARAVDIERVARGVEKFWASRKRSPLPRLLYGGGLALDNIDEILQVPWIGGALVGGASLSVRKFPALIAIAERLAGQ